MSDSRPIAVFDSGLGGLSVVRELLQLVPGEDIIYFGDTLRCPYGSRSTEAVREFAQEVATYLLSQDVKLFVAACNTVSATALDAIEACVGGMIPVIGVIEPGVKAGMESSSQKCIGVIGTRATIASRAYTNLFYTYDPLITVYEKACPLFVPFVEENILRGKLLEMLIDEYLDELVDRGVDTIVLGCTHYPLLKESIHSVVGGRVSIIDSAWWTAQEVRQMLHTRALFSPKEQGEHLFYVTDITRNFTAVSRSFLGRDVNVKNIDLHRELRKLNKEI
ncbi:glutamate racemase [Chitinivibrio alkaliphilus]|uniref:Glutamate racemase n=1 Tax=Chitinivibrio alkaliphilus ACht1 TaxID=1313304 RepID=U7D9Y9_9BACT|nr:glutamate racemase [Chitinivibrio alkaliphilus]ERP38807.1 glutamate racemase [Chitinivibrio alkaliphilus ACht1]